MNFGLPELLIILVIVLILFGSTRLPKLSRSIGESMKELREGISGGNQTPQHDHKTSKDSKETSATNKVAKEDKSPKTKVSSSETGRSFYRGKK